MGTTIKRTAKRTTALVAVAFIIALLALPTLSVLALEDPTIMSIKDVTIVQSVYEPDDFLLVFHYAVSWDPPENQPEEPADETFLFRLTNIAETEILGIAVPYVYVYSGYGEGCASMYWSEEDNPGWEEDFTLRFEENPGAYETPVIVRLDITEADYFQHSIFENEKKANQQHLNDYLINLALELETAWGVPGEIITDSNYLTGAGETYFQGAIPGLRAFCPGLFSIQSVAPQADKEEWTHAQEEEYKGQWGEGWVADALAGLGDLFGGVGWGLITGLGCGVLFLGIMVFSYVKLESTKPGLLLGTLPLIAGTMLGFMPLGILAIVAFLFILFLAYVFFLRGAS